MEGYEEENMEVKNEENDAVIVEDQPTQDSHLQEARQQVTTNKEGVNFHAVELDDEEQRNRQGKHLKNVLDNWDAEEAAQDKDECHAVAFWNLLPATNIKLDGGMCYKCMRADIFCWKCQWSST